MSHTPSLVSAEDVFVHPMALVESEKIGVGTRIWAFAHVMKSATIGRDCNIGDHAFVESGVIIGDQVTVKNGVSIWEGVRIGDKVFVGPNVVFTNDLRPRSRVFHDTPVETEICEGASLGANSTIKAGITIGGYAMIGAGSVVTKSVKDFELVYGNPAQHRGWVSIEGDDLNFVDDRAIAGGNSYRIDGDKVLIEEN